MPAIVLIIGVPGSGKTWLASKIKNELGLTVYDTSAVIRSVYVKLRPELIKKFPMWSKAYIKILEKACVAEFNKLLTDTNEIIVFSGNPVIHIKSKYVFFITHEDLSVPYRRTLVRDSQESKQKALQTIVQNSPINWITTDFEILVGKTLLPTTFLKYKQEYSRQLKQSIKNKHIQATQDEIFTKIKELATEQAKNK